MTRAYVYLALCVVGTLVPGLAMVSWVMDHGVDISKLVEELFVNRVSAAFGLDVAISAIVLFVFITWEGKRIGLTNLWLPAAATVLGGVSCGFPLFLFLRERRLRPSTRLDQ